MIAVPKPGSDAWAVLRLVVRHPGELDTGAIAGAVWPYRAVSDVPPLRWSPAGAGAAYREWLAGIGGRHQAEEAHRRAAAERVSKLLHRLQQIGLVDAANRHPPVISAWFEGMAATGGDSAALRAALEAGESKILDDEEPADNGEDNQQMLALIAEVRKGPGFAVSGRGGTDKRAYARLVELGVVVPPSYRWPTEAGRLLIETTMVEEDEK